MGPDANAGAHHLATQFSAPSRPRASPASGVITLSSSMRRERPAPASLGGTRVGGQARAAARKSQPHAAPLRPVACEGHCFQVDDARTSSRREGAGTRDVIDAWFPASRKCASHVPQETPGRVCRRGPGRRSVTPRFDVMITMKCRESRRGARSSTSCAFAAGAEGDRTSPRMRLLDLGHKEHQRNSGSSCT